MRNIYTLVIALFLTVNSWAQAPQKMSYQAVIRNTSNALIISSPVGMQISIIQGSITGSVVYTETQTTNTNANGLVSIEIGNGTVVTGTFATINWANGPYFIKTETDPTGGTLYTISGISELLSVPYALHSKTAESITGGITETDPVFVASPANGITSTNIINWNNKLDTEVDGSVTNEIQTLRISNDTIYLSNDGFAKLPAGFDGNYNSLINTPTAVSSFSNDAGYLTSFTETDGSVTNELQTLSISNDTIYLSNGGFTKLPAGFDGNYNSLTNTPTAVSSFSNDAGYLTSFTETDASVTNELQTLRISNDTIYLSNGGFAKLPATNAWSLNGNAGTVNGTNFIGTTDNVALNFKVNNQKAGRIDANSDVFLGYQAGSNNTATENTAIGFQALQLTNNPLSLANTAIGYKALRVNNGLGRNTAVGTHAMLNNTTGEWNTAVGSSALVTNTSGSHNTAIGGTALQGNISSAANAALGYGALIDHQSGDANTGIGMYALKGNLNGSNNVGLGFESGYNNLSGTGNIFIGYRAGYSETGSNKLYIANSSTTTPLIYGDFVSGNVGLGTTSPTYKLEVSGDAQINGVPVGKGSGIGQYNVRLGLNNLSVNTSGGYNTALGTFALMRNTIGDKNTANGYAALYYLTSGSHNTGIGEGALYANSTGNQNTALGEEAGRENLGSSNVFIGYQAGYYETGSNKLYIANSNTTTPLIYGDFATGNVGLGATTPTSKFQVETYGFSNKTIWGMNSMLIQNQTPGSRTLLALAPNGTQNADFVIYHNSDYTTNTEALSLGYENTLNNFIIGTSKTGTGSARRLVLDATGAGTNFWKQLTLATNGNVGIGTLTPGAKLEVAGNIKIADGTEGLNKVLTSDATGLATWQAKESKAYGMIYRINAFDIPLVSTWTNLPLDGGESNLINVVHSTSVNPERITVGVSGTYIIQYVIHYRRQNFPHHGVSRLMKNGSNEILGSYTVASPISGDSNEEDPLSTQVITTLSANDYINLQVATNVNLTNEVDSYVGPDLPAPTTKVSVSITIVKIGD
ncbi:MAG: hypothetical protein IPH32_08485 [Bacteroidetes bacterium]|nr:hypothetical protein [Bacteroidota bacterium]